MQPEMIKNLLQQLKEGSVSVEDAMEHLAKLPFRNIGIASVDHHRALRTGFPEVVLGESKTVEQIVSIVKELATTGQNVLVTRVSAEKAARVKETLPQIDFDDVARLLFLRQQDIVIQGVGTILVVTAGTSDLGVAREAQRIAQYAGNEVRLINDVGVAGVHRLLDRIDDLRSATVIIVVAGMEGALPSVVGGLVSCPVIAVPTSIGYGVSQGGFAALAGMLSSCSAGITVVNIDNGFGAGYAASLMNRIGRKEHHP